MNVVWASAAMQHFGQVVASALGWTLFVDAPVLDADDVYVIGMYDPPTYNYTLDMTRGAKRRIIHWCGSDVYALTRPDHLPEAVHLCESDTLRIALAEKGVIAKTVTFPTSSHPEVTPLPDDPIVGVYLGSNPVKYGEQVLRAIAEAMPDVKFNAYTYGTYPVEQMPDVIAKSSVNLRLVYPDGSANSAREYMEGGRRAITAVELPFSTCVGNTDIPRIMAALRESLSHTEPDYEAAAFYHEFNSVERYLSDLEAVL